MKRIEQRLAVNMAEGVRRETYDGAAHVVFPAVLVVEGVLNNALVLASEMAAVVESWNGRPIPVYHPTELGEPISANSPDVLERTIGTIFNARVDGNKLKAELWINETKADKLGYSTLISSMMAGQVVELSTGYLAKAESAAGEYNGKSYIEVHRQIQPDHVALLPGDVGACSVADGCGTPRIHKQGTIMKINEQVRSAFKALSVALGLSQNCNCQEIQMNREQALALAKKLCGNKADQKLVENTAKRLMANKSITAEQLEMLQKMDGDQLNMATALIGALSAPVAAEEEPPMEEETPPANAADSAAAAPAAQQQNKGKTETYTKAEVDALIANAIKAAGTETRREAVVKKLLANKACAFTEAEMKAMAVEHLEKYELSIRPADYSGQGGFGGDLQTADAPLVINSGLLAGKPQQKKAD